MNSNNQMIAAAGMISICSSAIGIKMAKKKENRKRGHEERHANGHIQMLLKEFNLCKYLNGGESYILMDELCFLELLSYIEANISKQNMPMKLCVPAKERLACTLRFLATGENFNELNKNTKLSPSFLRNAVLEVCEAIYTNLKDNYLMFPKSKAKWLEIAEGFENLWQFPHCLGALGSKHIAFTPSKDQHLFYNDKGFSSIVLLALCDANCKFTYVDIGCNGCISDGHVLMRSDLMAVLDQAESVFPKPDVIGDNRKVPYVIVADNAFPNMMHLMTPYPRNTTEKNIINFNIRLSRARQNIERAFAVLTNRFRIFQNKIRLDREKTMKIVQCCCVLHNFLVEKSLSYRQHLNEIAFSNGFDLEDDDEGSTYGEVENVRKTFVEYFCNEGNLKK